MNWGVYKQILDGRVSDAWYNFEEAEKKYKQAKAEYEYAMAARESFDVTLEEHLNKLEEA